MAHLFSRMLAALALCASLTSHAAPGDLDTTFGSGTGKVITAIGSLSASPRALALQPDGKIVVAGRCFNGSTFDFCLARFLPSGAFDISFSGTGTVITAMGSGIEYAVALALQPDGKIIVAGGCRTVSNYDFCVARYLASGALDTTFGTAGKVYTAIGSIDDSINALALQPDGKIIVAGNCYKSGNITFCVARYLPSGALDASFNGAGNVVTAIGSGSSAANALALQPDGKIVAAGPCSNGSSYNFCLARYLPNGALDTSFNTTGQVMSAIGVSNDIVTALALQPDGKIVATGECSIGGHFAFCLTRYLVNGALDTSFNTTGTVITTIASSDNIPYSLALQPDGKIVVAGSCSNGSSNNFCLARYLPDGALDVNLNTTGTITTAMGSNTNTTIALALQSDGKIVLAGGCVNGNTYDFCLARYEGGPFDARNCSMDIDGDNQTFATTDGLIATRVMLGLTGNAVIGGITFASHATRTTWPAIRDYLVSQCGMSIAP